MIIINGDDDTFLFNANNGLRNLKPETIIGVQNRRLCKKEKKMKREISTFGLITQRLIYY